MRENCHFQAWDLYVQRENEKAIKLKFTEQKKSLIFSTQYSKKKSTKFLVFTNAIVQWMLFLIAELYSL